MLADSSFFGSHSQTSILHSHLQAYFICWGGWLISGRTSTLWKPRRNFLISSNTLEREREAGVSVQSVSARTQDVRPYTAFPRFLGKQSKSFWWNIDWWWCKIVQFYGENSKTWLSVRLFLYYWPIKKQTSLTLKCCVPEMIWAFGKTPREERNFLKRSTL